MSFLKDLLSGGLDPNATWADPFGRVPNCIIVEGYCKVCGNKVNKKGLDDYGMCPRCQNLEDKMAERLFEKYGLVDDKRLDKEFKDRLPEDLGWIDKLKI